MCVFVQIIESALGPKQNVQNIVAAENDRHPLTVIVPRRLLTRLDGHWDPLGLLNLRRCFPEWFSKLCSIVYLCCCRGLLEFTVDAPPVMLTCSAVQ